MWVIERVRLLLAVAMGMAFLPAHARANPLLVDDTTQEVSGTRSLEILLDNNGTLELTDARAAKEAGKFRTFKAGESPIFKHLSGRFWTLLVVQHVGVAQKELIIVWDDPLADELDLFVLRGAAEPMAHRLGAIADRESRSFTKRTPRLKLALAPGETVAIYARYRSDRLFATVELFSPAQFHRQQVPINVFFSTYFSISIALFIYNVFLYVSLRYRFYLHYLGFIGSMVFALGMGEGFTVLYLPQWPLLSPSYTGVWRGVAMVAGILFTRSFLNMRTVAPRFDLALRGLTVATVILTLSGIIPPLRIVTGTITDILMLPASFMFLAAAILAFRRGHRPGQYYMVSWSGMILSVLVWVPASFGMISVPYYEYFPMVGQMFEMIVIAIGLGDHINNLIAQLKEAEVKVQEAEKTRTLLRVISHDLANPLSVVLNFATYHLRDSDSVKGSRKSWERVCAAVEQQAAIIKHVSEMESLKTGKRKVQLGPVGLRNAIAQVELLFEQKLLDKDLRLTCDFGPTDLYVVAESTTLKSTVLANLVSNAIKFSNPGTAIRIVVSPTLTHVTIAITDSGIGMDASLIAKIFDPYKPTTRPGTKGERGTGFGMPMVMTYVTEFGGSLEVRSVPVSVDPVGHGTTFFVTLKRAPVPREEALRAAA